MHWFWMALSSAFAMFWETFWALVLGFGISAALQVFVSREQMTRAFGRTGLREMLLATGLGAASSSCSYAAAAAGRSAFQKGAALVPVLAFMFASTNLVAELGAMLWVLMGWHFVLAEVIGAFVLIGVMWLAAKWIFPRHLEAEARSTAERVSDESHGCCSGKHELTPAHTQSKWSLVAEAFVMDWTMLWKQMAAGFLISGFLVALVPAEWWRALFLQSGPAPLRLIENALVGPLIGAVSFLCSCANIPLASVLWAHGITFGGVISFIYADLIAIPLILIYWKYFGGRAATYITIVFYLSMVAAGVIVDLLFSALGLIPQGPRSASAMDHGVIVWNYTTWLDMAALVVASLFFYLSFRNRIRARVH